MNKIVSSIEQETLCDGKNGKMFKEMCRYMKLQHGSMTCKVREGVLQCSAFVALQTESCSGANDHLAGLH